MGATIQSDSGMTDKDICLNTRKARVATMYSTVRCDHQIYKCCVQELISASLDVGAHRRFYIKRNDETRNVSLNVHDFEDSLIIAADGRSTCNVIWNYFVRKADSV